MFFQPKAGLQVAALPFIVADRGVEVLLITTRDRGRWVVPKGWPEAGLSHAAAAEREAVEEAGVFGRIAAEPIGSFRYVKLATGGDDIDCRVLVFPLLVTGHHIDWPERAERRLAWHPLAAAARLVDDEGLARIIAGFARDCPAVLRRLGHRAAA